jgi:apolipoprotein N-acyltransferase
MCAPLETVRAEPNETKPGSQLPDATLASFQPIAGRRAAGLALVVVACFHSAYLFTPSGLLAPTIVGYVMALVQLARLRTTRQCFYTGLATGFACMAPQLECFWRIFDAAAIALWLILSLWIASFVVLAHLALLRLGPKRAAVLLPFLWTGLEYFRSELYYLKFSWLNVGYAFAESTFIPMGTLGVYGVGFVAAAWSSLFLVLPARRILSFALPAAAIGLVLPLLLAGAAKPKSPLPTVRIAGIQLEFPDPSQIVPALDRVLAADRKLQTGHGETRPLPGLSLLVLSEYTLDGEPSDALREWCRTNQKFLIVGGKQALGTTNFYNTAFVIAPSGAIVFKQVKCVPIQFFADGRPAPEQQVWDSPWGKIGLCVCYDLSYTRVTDELVRQGAQLIIAPTMDVAEWGRRQHELHARVAPVRAAEYGIPIFRLASSGISQGVNRKGRTTAGAPFPGAGEILFFDARIAGKGSLPGDRWFAPACVGITTVFLAWLIFAARKRQRALPAPVTLAAE